jgi:hypothetical protein
MTFYFIYPGTRGLSLGFCQMLDGKSVIDQNYVIKDAVITEAGHTEKVAIVGKE